MRRSADIRRSQAGFTLVEMMVALIIFSLLAAAGVGILRSSVDLQNGVNTRLTELGGMARLNALLTSDLGQAVVRASRAPEGERPAFVGDGSGMEFVSTGHANLDGSARSELQRVEWRLDRNVLQRTGFNEIDGTNEGQSSPVARDVSGASFRYRMPDGSWNASFTSTEPQPLPTAVELTLTPRAGPPVTMVFALPLSALQASENQPTDQGPQRQGLMQ